tara:strand:+ start:348 stop:551 length:204 start_codon:yes stop_codon:yes gene_type:complete
MNQIKEQLHKTCDECDGEGVMIYSCCGDDMLGADIDICPSCGEHTGMEEEECEECNGKGDREEQLTR